MLFPTLLYLPQGQLYVDRSNIYAYKFQSIS